MVATTELPGGSVTFLFTDIEGSTRIMSQVGDRYHLVIDLHHEVLRACWARHGGHEVNTEGDAFFVAFASADDAVHAAVDAQRSIGQTSWPDGIDLRVRMGLHRGFARPHNNDYSAMAVNQAARVVSAAHGGQILLTEEVAAALQDTHDFEDLGPFRLRDFPGPAVLLRAVAEGWEGSAKPPRARPVDGHNLVRPVMGLVDRVQEFAWLREHVVPGAEVTIAGTGGVGKTRMAVGFAWSVLDDWPGGVWLVELETARREDRVANAIAEAIGASQEPGLPAIEDVCRHLGSQRTLLILDNCEQALEPTAGCVSRILSACPEVAVLLTSRAPLGMRGERVLRLGPLATDGEGAPAVELFLERAAAEARDDLASVRRLCERLEGLPLALELAAVHTSLMPTAAIVEMLDEAPWLMDGRDPTLPARHRSLDHVLDWSRDLLPDTSVALFRRLSAMTDGFDLSLASAVCADEALDAREVPRLLWSLVDQSLVSADLASGSTRFRLLSPVRSYAARLCSSHEWQATTGALARVLMDRLGPSRATHPSWVSEMGIELDNVRGVIADIAPTDQPTAQALAWSVAHFEELRAGYATAIEEIHHHLELLPQVGPERVALQAQLADVRLRMGQVDEAEVVLDAAAMDAARVGVPTWNSAALLRPRGEIAVRRGRYADAELLGRTMLAEARDPRSRARAWNLIGLCAAMKEQYESAAEAFQRELAAAEEDGFALLLPKTHTNLAEIYFELGDLRACARHQRTCLELSRSAGERHLVAYSVVMAARLLQHDGQTARAVTLHESATTALADVGHVFYDTDAEQVRTFLARARSQLGSPAFEDAVKAGTNLHLDSAADAALEVLEAQR